MSENRVVYVYIVPGVPTWEHEKEEAMKTMSTIIFGNYFDMNGCYVSSGIVKNPKFFLPLITVFW